MSLNKVPAWTLLLCALLIGMWWLSTFQYTMKWDIMDITLPWQYFISESINGGELPLWNPFVKNGFPQMGLQDTWYPVTWLIAFLFGMDVWSIQFSYLLHLFIAGLGMYKYLQGKTFGHPISVAMGVCYMFSGFMIGNAQHLGWVVGAAWLPWVFYYFDRMLSEEVRGDFLRLAFVGAMLFYGAYLPITIVVVYILVAKLVISFWKNPSRKLKLFQLSISLTILLLIAAVGLIGLLDLAPNLNRGRALPLSSEGWGVLSGYFPLKAISSLVIPYAGGAADEFWGSDISLINTYFGLIPLLLCVVVFWVRSRQGIKYFCIGMLFLLIAMAEVFPFRAWLYYLPLWDKFRFPSLFRLFFIFYMMLACTYGYQALRAEDRISLFYKIVVAALILILGLQSYSFFHTNSENIQILFSHGLFEFHRQSNFTDRATINLLIHAVVLGLLFLSFLIIRDVKKVIPYFIVLEVLIISQWNISETVVHKADPAIGNAEINSFDGSSVNVDLTRPMNTFSDGRWKDELSWFRFNQACITKTPSPSGSSPFSLLSYKAAIDNDEISINKYPLFFLGEIENGSVVREETQGEITVMNASNNGFELEVTCKDETNLVFLQNIYKGWKLKVNGELTEIRKVNTTFMSAELKSGTHNVKFFFRPMKMIVAFYLSMISFLVALLGLVYYKLSSA